MKRLLIIRVPFGYKPVHIEKLFALAKKELEPVFHVLLCLDEVPKVEFEIIYDPHFKPFSFEFNGEPVNEEQLKQRLKEFLFDEKPVREFMQTDTSTNAYMEGRPNA